MRAIIPPPGCILLYKDEGTPKRNLEQHNTEAVYIMEHVEVYFGVYSLLLRMSVIIPMPFVIPNSRRSRVFLPREIETQGGMNRQFRARIRYYYRCLSRG